MENNQEYVELDNLIQELQGHKNNILILRKLIRYASLRDNSFKGTQLQWDIVLAELFRTITSNTQIGGEKLLLTSHAFFALISTECSSIRLKNIAKDSLQLASFNERNEIYFVNKKYVILDIDLFKLIIAYGYLQLNRHNNDCSTIYTHIFDVLYPHCIRYNRYSYFAYKVLHIWLNRTMATHFWNSNDVNIEKRLESIIFSNWHNAISDISKQNATAIFNVYLQIMNRKYDGFLNFLFERCINDLSWHNEIKYIILAEVCKVWNDIEAITSENFLTCLCISLTKNYLRVAGRNVYMSILRKIHEDKWKDSFSFVLKSAVYHWELDSNRNDDAIRLLCKFWLEPAAKEYENILPHLWHLYEDLQSDSIKSHLQRMASEIQIDMPKKIDPTFYMTHANEDVRLNGFAICSHQLQKLIQSDRDNLCCAIKQFLWYNANTTSIYLREGIIKYFEIFYINLLKITSVDDNEERWIEDMMAWLHEFVLDCFEIGSCYQRKIFGLSLYHLILSFTGDISKSNNLKGSRCKKLLSSERQKLLLKNRKFEFIDRKSFFLLLRLVLDTVNDIRETAATIILDHFHHNLLTDSEKRVLFKLAMSYCDSSKFYEIESGTILMKLLAIWMPKNNFQNPKDGINAMHLNYSEFLFKEAQIQLLQLKQDILKGIVQNTPFYGALYALLKIGLQQGPESQFMTITFTENLLDLLEDAINFFLSVLSSKATDTSTSSSFAEMGLAIDEAIKASDIDEKEYDELSLSPAHRIIISCIWMSLKVCCDMSSEIGKLMYSARSVHRALSLIATVSLKCRHKGAVESAGNAIGALSKCLHNKEEYSELPRTYIEKLLQREKNSTLNLTRRGAGLSIMFHRIVVSDNRRERPLVHFAVKALLQSLEEEESYIETIDSQHDLPQARYLHFLRFLVADKEIHAQLVPYIEQISLLCFKFLQSEIWVIRNAGLQLYGAVVPRLVGQNTGKVLNFGNGYSIDHFVTHYPILAQHFTKKLRSFSRLCENSSVPLHMYSSIVHILILLSKMSCSGCDLTEFSSKIFIEDLKSTLPALLASPVAQIRILVAKVYASMTASSDIPNKVEKFLTFIPTIRNANTLHGCLLTMYYLKQKFDVEMEGINNLTKVMDALYEKYAELHKDRCTHLMNLLESSVKIEETHRICYVTETMFWQLMNSDKICLEKYILQESFNWSLERIKPGFPDFVILVIKNMTKFMNNKEMEANENIAKKILNSQNVELIIIFLNHISACLPLLKIVMNQLLFNIDNCNHLVLNAMVSFVIECLKQSPMNREVEKTSTQLIMKIRRQSNTNLMQLKRILLIQFCMDEETLCRVLLEILELCIHKEEEFRQCACECIQFALCRFENLRKTNKIIIIQCCLLLLKDEVSEIGASIVASLRSRILPKMWDNVQFSEIIYENLLSLFASHRCDENINFLTKYTKDVKQPLSVPTIENPFMHDDESLYKEETKFLNIYCLATLYTANDLTLCTETKQSKKIIDATEVISVKYKLQQNIGLDFNNLQNVLNLTQMEYLSRKINYVKELCHKH